MRQKEGHDGGVPSPHGSTSSLDGSLRSGTFLVLAGFGARLQIVSEFANAQEFDLTVSRRKTAEFGDIPWRSP
jgi:hypothetical protein